MSEPHGNNPPPASAADIRLHLLTAVARELELNLDEVRSDQPLLSYGIDSMQLIGLIGELEEKLNCRILANPLPQFPTVDKLANWIAAELAAGRTRLHPNHPV